MVLKLSGLAVAAFLGAAIHSAASAEDAALHVTKQTPWRVEGFVQIPNDEVHTIAARANSKALCDDGGGNLIFITLIVEHEETGQRKILQSEVLGHAIMQDFQVTGPGRFQVIATSENHGCGLSSSLNLFLDQAADQPSAAASSDGTDGRLPGEQVVRPITQ
jgi:hypothetical protein